MSAERPSTEPELRAWILRRVAVVLKVNADALDPGAPFSSHGMDSLTMVELLGELENVLGRAIPEGVVWKHPSIDKLARALAVASHDG